MPVFQELITRLILESEKYVAGANRVKASTHEATLAIDELVLHSKEAGAKVGEALRFGELVAPLAAAASAVGIIELGKHAEETALEFDKLERHILGVTRSAQRTKEIMDFGEKQSGLFGIASPEQLDSVAAQLETLKLRTEEYLPVLEKLAVLSPEGAASMTQFAEAFALIEQGQGGRAIRELERIGITIKDLERHGLRFTGVDEQTGMRTLVTPPRQALKGIEATINEVGGPVLQEFMNSPEARFQRFKNAADQAFRSAGNEIIKDLVPAAEAGNEAIEHLTESGRIAHMTDAFLNFLGLESTNLEEGFMRIGEWITGIPDMLNAGKKKLMEWLPVLADIGEVMAGIFVGIKMASWVEAAVAGYRAVGLAAAAAAAAEETAEVASGVGIGVAVTAAAAGVAAYEGLKSVIDNVTDSVNALSDAHQHARVAAENAVMAQKREEMRELLQQRKQLDAEIDKAKGAWDYGFYGDDKGVGEMEAKGKTLDQKIRALQLDMNAADKTPDKKLESKPDPLNPQTQLLQQIAVNTKEIAHDLRRYALGGGDLGREGVAAVDMRSGAAKGRLVAAITEFVDAHTSKAIAGNMRYGH